MDNASNKVNIVDIKMPFWSMVIFMVKASIAAIPAMIILTIIFAILSGIFKAILGLIG